MDSLCSAFADTLSGGAFLSGVGSSRGSRDGDDRASVGEPTTGTTAAFSLSRHGLHEHCLEVTGAAKASLVWALER